MTKETAEEKEAREYCEELFENHGTMLEPGQSVNNQEEKICLNTECSSHPYRKITIECESCNEYLPNKLNHTKSRDLEIVGAKSVKVLDSINKEHGVCKSYDCEMRNDGLCDDCDNYHNPDWNYHTVKLRGVELDSLPEGWTLQQQMDKIKEEIIELENEINYPERFFDLEKVAMEIGDVRASTATLEKMLGIDIEEANRKNCAKMEGRLWRARL